jgi:hypothetical protein
MLACSNTHGYKLLAGEPESNKEGRPRKIMVSSIKALVAPQLAGGTQ